MVGFKDKAFNKHSYVSPLNIPIFQYSIIPFFYHSFVPSFQLNYFALGKRLTFQTQYGSDDL